MNVRFRLPTLFFLISGLSVLLGSKVYLSGSRDIASIKDESLQAMVYFQLWADIPLLLVWFVAAEWILRRTSYTTPGRRLVLTALTINIIWTLMIQPFISPILDAVLPTSQTLRWTLSTFIGYSIFTVCWSLVLIGYGRQCMANADLYAES